MMPHKVCKLSVLRVELNDAYPVLDFLQEHMVSVGLGTLHRRQINSKLKQDVAEIKKRDILHQEKKTTMTFPGGVIARDFSNCSNLEVWK